MWELFKYDHYSILENSVYIHNFEIHCGTNQVWQLCIQGVAFTKVNTVTRVSTVLLMVAICIFVYSDNVIIRYICFNKIEDSQSAITINSYPHSSMHIRI